MAGILDDLKALNRLFPNATELAVTPEMIDAFETETAYINRFYGPRVNYFYTPPVEETLPALGGGTFAAQRLPWCYRATRLTLVGEVRQ